MGINLILVYSVCNFFVAQLFVVRAIGVKSVAQTRVRLGFAFRGGRSASRGEIYQS